MKRRWKLLGAALGMAFFGAIGASCTSAEEGAPVTPVTPSEPVGEAQEALCGFGGFCSSGLTCCTSRTTTSCVNLTSDSSNCGSCGHACGAGQTCSSGQCVCHAPATLCNGVCVNLQTSVTNCGACGTSCPSANGTPSCTGGVCSLSCTGTFQECNSYAPDGCETNTATSAANCGACNSPCSVPAATAVCVGSTCQVGTCNAGFGDCDGLVANGCETNVNTSAAHCGTCGTSCALGDSCENGSCVHSCTDNAGCSFLGLAQPACCSGICRDLNSPCACGSCGGGGINSGNPDASGVTCCLHSTATLAQPDYISSCGGVGDTNIGFCCNDPSKDVHCH